jgi:hypothetical protein
VLQPLRVAKRATTAAVCFICYNRGIVLHLLQ